MNDLDIVAGPLVEHRAEKATLGIRETVPFRTMLSNRDRLLAELVAWLEARGIEPAGPFFLRLHVVDMSGLMQIEVGVVAQGEGDQRVLSSSLPAGEYAVLAYRAKSMAANKALRQWAHDEGLVLDAQPTAEGEAFACRCEIYLTDPRTEKRKTRWVVELAFKVRSRP